MQFGHFESLSARISARISAQLSDLNRRLPVPSRASGTGPVEVLEGTGPVEVPEGTGPVEVIEGTGMRRHQLFISIGN